MGLIDQAIALHQAGRLTEAEALYRLVLEADSRDFDALHMLGIICAQRQQFEEAERLIRNALSIDANVASCHHNYGNVLAKLNRLEDAIDSHDKALAIAPDDALIYSDLGLTQKQLGRFDEALASFAKALEIDPDFTEAHLNLGVCRLLRGDFARGWEAFGEWRWNEEEHQTEQRRNFSQPLWRGANSLRGKTILLHAEHGYGDTIQFCRYVRPVADLGAKVVLEAPLPLLGLLAGLDGPAQVVQIGERLPAFDCHCSLLSLPFAFKTTLENIPGPTPYLAASPDLIKKWSLRLGEKDRPRIGVAWSGNTTRLNDHDGSSGLRRLLPLQELGLQLVSLQKELTDQDQEVLHAHDDILHFDQSGFSDTAALISLMDIVVSIDTSIAHLAGALGAPTWVLVPFVPDWRWLLDRADSPWYPTVRLFRQPRIGDWDSVVQLVLQELRSWHVKNLGRVLKTSA